MRRRTLISGFLCLGCLMAAPPASADGLRVAASIRPIHSLAAQVMEGVGAPHLLVQGAGSPHAYSLKPSEARALAEAHVVFLIDEGFEAFLTKPLANLSKRARIVALADQKGVKTLPPRRGGAWDDHNHDRDRKPKGHDGHEHGALDGHLWLDVGNARAILGIMAAVLAELDPANGARYRANAAKAEAVLAALDAELSAITKPLAARPFIVFHDAYQYFEARHGLAAAGSVTVSPDKPPGAKRLTALRERIAKAKIACIFAEPQFKPAIAESLAKDSGARTGVLDPLGADIAPGPDHYPAMMRALASGLRECLQ